MDATVEVKDEDAYTNIVYTGKYDVEKASYNLGISVANESSEVANLAMNGIVENLVKGKSANFVLDSMAININDEPVIELSGNYSLMPMDGEVTSLEGEGMDILAATEEEWQAVIMDGYTKFMEIASKLQ